MEVQKINMKVTRYDTEFPFLTDFANNRVKVIFQDWDVGILHHISYCCLSHIADSIYCRDQDLSEARVIGLSLLLRLITLISTLIILDITKTSSNNCFL